MVALRTMFDFITVTLFVVMVGRIAKGILSSSHLSGHPLALLMAAPVRR
jgi:hypothetical protein